ncbi:fasciclin-like arabinogalactan protein 9 [Nymphaea colorata]|uniref:fasciclin-like arabinogalactan protein 9 n=1 Tax=Nymphaea colorata TaxID=210225 RepID=UPI00214E81F3|nr:fasciclin-like arabinogalactan protein 9 [Nymphaea colorata]
MAACNSFFILSFCLSSAILFSTIAATTPPLPPLNLIDTLQKGGQYSTLLLLLATTQVANELANELNNSFTKATFFAPTDGAFNSLQKGLLNSLTTEQMVKLLNFHVIPRLFTWSDFTNGVPPQQTQASGPDGPYFLNFTSISNQQVRVSTGLVETSFSNALNLTPPLAIYQVDQVLFPPDEFGVVSPPAPAPAPSPKSGAAPSSSPSPSSSASPSAPPPSSSPPQPSPPSPAGAAPSNPASDSPVPDAPGSTGSEVGSAPAALNGLWGLILSLMAAVGVAYIALVV